MRRGLVETLMGAIVLAGAAGFLILALGAANVGTERGYELSARFLKVGGLERGSDVRISGVKVGSVIDRSLDRETFEAVVRFPVRDDMRLPADTEAGDRTSVVQGKGG